MSDAIVLRSYLRDDLEAMFRLDVACFDETFRFSKADMRRFAESRKAQVLIAEYDKQPVGFSIVHAERSRDESVGYLLTLDVASAFRRCGLAQRILTRAEQDARKADCSAMLLHVFTGNSDAIALYEKCGYSRSGIVENFYSAGLDAWLYRKPLA